MYKTMSIGDVDEIFKLEQQVYSTPWTRKELRQHLDVGLGLLWIEKGRIVAYGLIVQDRKWFHLTRLVVDPKRQGRGIGRKLLNMISLNRPMIVNVCDVDMEAQCFLRACGYKCTKVKRGYFDDGSDSYVFKNQIEKART